jgi:molybdate transport system ATP-binding protein
MITINIEKKLKAYSGQQWLKVNREFADGSITKIHGPSGAGKTTFLKIIAGLISPEKGSIKVDDTIWLDTSVKNLSITTKKNGWFCISKLCAVPKHDGT